MSPAGREPVATGAVDAIEARSTIEEETLEAGVEVGATATEVELSIVLLEKGRLVAATLILELLMGEVRAGADPVMIGIAPLDPKTDPDGKYPLEADPVGIGAEPLDASVYPDGKIPPVGDVVANAFERAAGALLDNNSVPVIGTVDGAP